MEAEKTMSDAANQAKRAAILNGIRRSLHRGELSGAERQTVEARLAAPQRGPAVARANLPQP
jgi:L-lactate dehydrogenase complex protein LldG